MDAIETIQAQAQLAALPVSALAALNARAEWYKKQARPNQLPPSDQSKWDTCVVQAGRGFGKTRLAVEWLWWEAWCDPGSYNHVVVRRKEDLAKVAFEGPSGLFRRIPPEAVQKKISSPYEVHLVGGGAILGFSADDPDVLRGPECHRTWCDELAAWRRIDAAWNDGVMFGTRLLSERNCGRPKKLVTTTPRPLKFLRELLRDEGTITIRGSTYDNSANLAPGFLQTLEKKYRGTRRGRQELLGELLEDVPGALWMPAWIEDHRLWEVDEDFAEVVVAIDPAVKSEEGSNETGIVAVGRGRSGRGYVLADKSDVYSPEGWSTAAIELHDTLMADHITVEVNQGGEMCRSVLKGTARRMYQEQKRKSPEVGVKMVHASRGKEIRAEPISQFYEQGRVSHVGDFGTLEDQMTAFTKNYDRNRDGSPDRLDALVWGFTDILLEPLPDLTGMAKSPTQVSAWKGAKLSFGV